MAPVTLHQPAPRDPCHKRHPPGLLVLHLPPNWSLLLPRGPFSPSQHKVHVSVLFLPGGCLRLEHSSSLCLASCHLRQSLPYLPSLRPQPPAHSSSALITLHSAQHPHCQARPLNRWLFSSSTHRRFADPPLYARYWFRPGCCDDQAR